LPCGDHVRWSSKGQVRVKQASSNPGLACEAELRARILTRSEGEVLKVNGRRCTFCRQDQQSPLGSRMAEAADWRAGSAFWKLSLSQLPASAASDGGPRALQVATESGSKHRASVLGKVWKPAGQSQSIVAARRSQSSQVERAKLGCRRTLDTAQTDRSHPCRVPIVRIVRVIGKKKAHDTLRFREVFPHRRESAVLRGGS
jgi:hypothetical protein